MEISMRRNFVVKIFKDNEKCYKVVTADNEKACRYLCAKYDILFIFEIDPSIIHWNSYEIELFYGWLDAEKAFLPLNQKEVILEYLANNGEERRKWITKYAQIFSDFMENISMFKQYNECLELLKTVPTIHTIDFEFNF
jgi:hypothetical protein